MNVRSILGDGLPRRHRFVHRVRPLDDVRRLRNIGLRWMFEHASAGATCTPLYTDFLTNDA